jgi:DNA-directed RNA polymerase specialized sigma24 family protein
MREAIRARRTDLFERCANALIGQIRPDGTWISGHCQGIILAHARSFGLFNDSECLADYRQECLWETMRAIHAGSDKKGFWEERFGLALKQLCIDVGRRLVTRLRRFEWSKERTDPSDDSMDQVAGPSSVQDQVLSGIVYQDLTAAIRRLPPRQALAALLRWVEERPVTSANPGSVTQIMQISEQAVHGLLCKAKAGLQADQEIRKYLGDR